MHIGKSLAALTLVAGMGCGIAPLADAATTAMTPETTVAPEAVTPPARSLDGTYKSKRSQARRAGEYKVARKRRALRALGIAAGVAATAIIINEAAKAERRRRRARRHGPVHCHSGMGHHRHSALGGHYGHRHDVDCIAYREAAPPPPQVVLPSCDPGYEFVDGRCYLIDPGAPQNDQQALYDDAYDRCAARYRSFRFSDGTYQPYGRGGRRLCPYLGE